MRLTPPSSLDAYMDAVLWPGRGVRDMLSHETALDLYGLSDVNPAKIDVTLPRAWFRADKRGKPTRRRTLGHQKIRRLSLARGRS
jgi:hypothetical protein